MLVAFSFTIEDHHLPVLMVVIGVVGIIVAMVGAGRADKKQKGGFSCLWIGAVLFFPSYILFFITSDQVLENKKVREQEKELVAKRTDLPDPWFSIFELLDTKKSPQLNEIILRKRLETFDCTNTLPMAGFDRFMKVTQGEASSILEPCLQLITVGEEPNKP